jgi:hypothetical protein
MATKPTAARGKATTKGKFIKMTKRIEEILKAAKENPSLLGSPKGKGMSPGAMGGRTKPKPPSQFLRRRMKLKAAGMGPMVGTAAGAAGKGLGKSLSRAGMAGMSKAVFNEAKKRKPSGRLNVDDLKRARDMLKKRKGK